MKSGKINSPESMEKKYQLFLHDLGKVLADRAFEAKHERNVTLGRSDDYHFQSGRLMGFNEVISILQQQAVAFGIDLAEIQIDQIDPDRDLV
jgi:hypothetical protein